MDRTEIQMARVGGKPGNFYVPAELKLAFVIQIRDINSVSPNVHKVLQLFVFAKPSIVPLLSSTSLQLIC